MTTNGRKRDEKLKLVGSKTKGSFEDEVDALFQLPAAEFTSARNALAAQLKQSGRAGEATLVKTLTRPSISAWAVNQLYWNHRAAFEQLIATGQRIRQAQKSRIADMRESLEARRESLSELTDLATALLQEAGHNPSLDTARRITTTLEALSAFASLADGPTPGRLTQDVDPPGFESLASLMAGAGTTKASAVLTLVKSSPKATAAGKSLPKSSKATDAVPARVLEETRRARITAAKLSLQDAKKSLT